MRRAGKVLVGLLLLCIMAAGSSASRALPRYAVAKESLTSRPIVSLSFVGQSSALHGNQNGAAKKLIKGDAKLREQLQKLTDAFSRRDLETIRSQISPDRIFVEIADRAGAYLTNSQTAAVIESFLRTRTAVNCSFEFVSDDGKTGSAAGVLNARSNGRSLSYKLNFGFAKNEKGVWLLTRISMR